ncbi:unnamed protein product [Phytophthora fragariaefolia]|uniref:Unnamed protein product n=1 Tax=Phytophthora fragariaefolia TaxID=1490495 RepID=A0A9W6XNR4_9STRA|nr:unnamed protein product [Phytophthora fragariaefolia]
MRRSSPSFLFLNSRPTIPTTSAGAVLGVATQKLPPGAIYVPSMSLRSLFKLSWRYVSVSSGMAWNAGYDRIPALNTSTTWGGSSVRNGRTTMSSETPMTLLSDSEFPMLMLADKLLEFGLSYPLSRLASPPCRYRNPPAQFVIALGGEGTSRCTCTVGLQTVIPQMAPLHCRNITTLKRNFHKSVIFTEIAKH